MLNKLMFINHGDEGHNTWKCLACNSIIDAGYPTYEYSDENRIITGSSYNFCPICGIKFEGIHQNSKMDKPHFYQHNTEETMKMNYRRLHYIAENIRKNRKRYIDDMYSYRDEVAEFLDEMHEYSIKDLKFFIPKPPKRPN